MAEETMRDPHGTHEQVELFGVMIDNLTLDDAVAEVVGMAEEPVYRYVVTPNVDHIMRLGKDAVFRAAHDGAALTVCDGMPLVWASRLLGAPLKGRVNGTDLFERVVEAAADRGLRIYLLGARPGVAGRAAEVLVRRYPGLVVAGYEAPPFGFDTECEENDRVIRNVRSSGADILFVALGSPKQELWMARHGAVAGVRVALGIGASFDFVAGTFRRAPLWMQRHGLEWLWRLMSEPGRLWRRYLVDDIPFVWLVLREWWRKPRR